METALLITTALFQMRSTVVSLGLALGLTAAIAIALAWTRLGRGVDLKSLLNILAVFLAIFVVQLLLYGVHELSEARVLPSSQAVHDATEILGPDGKIGHLLAYSLAVVPTVWLIALWWKRRNGQVPVQTPRNAA
jgi:high-affinity iron transporter